MKFKNRIWPNFGFPSHFKSIFERPYKYVWPLAIILAFAGLLFTFFADFPGLMTTDSFDMWNMGVERDFTDWDAPLVSVLMLVSGFFRNDPALYLFFQLSLLWGGIYIFSLALRVQNGRWPILAVCIGFFPPIIGLSGYLQKTPLQASCFLFVFSVLYYLHVKKRKLSSFLFILLVFLLFIGTVIRDYTYLSALPILFFLFNILLKPKIKNNKKKWGIIVSSSLLMLMIFYFAHHFILYNLLEAEKKNKLYFLPRYELAGIYVHTGIRYADNLLIIDSHETARELYKKNHGLWRIYRFYRDPQNNKELMEMMAELGRAVLQNPLAYLQHRLNAISGALGISPSTRTWKFLNDYKLIKTNKYGISKSNNIFFEVLKSYQLFCRKHLQFILMPWFYAVINISLMIYCVIGIKKRKRDDFMEQWPHFIILLSGFLFLLVYIFICNANLNRYSYWLIVSTCFGGFGLYSTKNSKNCLRKNQEEV
jgi:hypothetical protein